MTKRRTPAEQQRYMAQRAYRLEREYGITLEEYELIKEAQGGTCAICVRARGLTSPLQVDHDHGWDPADRRGSVRGLLCGRDNNRLGWFEAKRTNVLTYLDQPPAWGVLR